MKSDNHAKAVSSHPAKSKPQETPIERALLKMESGELENRRKQFNSACYIACNELPFTV